MWKIWDRKFGYHCLTLYSREQAQEMVRHFKEVDLMTGEYMKNRYRIDRHEKDW